ncbi:MAG: hypothetical protein LBR50_07500 [Tannerella sp.]|jgi:hypothetical protein|nr:hypothetical protein [Tannerella sp.]
MNNKLFVSLLAIVLGFSFVACDKDKEEKVSAAKAVEGSYVGAVSGLPESLGTTTLPLTLILEYASDTKVNVSVEGGSILSFPIEKFSADVTSNGKTSDGSNKYHINGSGTVSIDGTDFPIPVLLDGDIVDDTPKYGVTTKAATLTITVGAGVPEGTVPLLPLTLNYTGVAN